MGFQREIIFLPETDEGALLMQSPFWELKRWQEEDEQKDTAGTSLSEINESMAKG